MGKGPRRIELDELVRPGKSRSTRQADYMRRRRAANGWTQLAFTLDVAPAACLLYLQKQWGFKSRRETVQVALQYLAKETRLGLKQLKLGFGDDD